MEGQPVVINGSVGEGGGQILRSALSIASVLGIKIKIINIRAKRRNPGLRPQHLTAVRALQALTNARVKGDYVGSTEIVFEPTTIKGGEFFFDIGTAGSISLLLQAILPVTAFAPEPVSITVRGGTDVKMAPLIDYMRFVFKELLKKFNYNVNIELLRRGHYPRGGGLVRVVVDNPPRKLTPVDLTSRGRLLAVEGISHCVRLPSHVALRQARSASRIIEKKLKIKPKIKVEFYPPGEDPHLGPGSGIVLWGKFESSIIGSDALGEKGLPAEEVGRRVAMVLIEDIKSGASVDRYASDMLPIYMALASGTSKYTGALLTSHAETMFWLLTTLIRGAEVKVRGKRGEPFYAVIKGISYTR